MPKSNLLVLAEKPDAARKIAQALAADVEEVQFHDGAIRVSRGFDGNSYLVCSALGHLYGLVDQHEKRSIYPVLDLEWTPISRRKSSKAGSVNYRVTDFLALKKIGEISRHYFQCDRIVNACDYDPEGETIGYNTLIFASTKLRKDQEILRAKFSTLTTEEIRDSFSRLSPSDRKSVHAGRMRHVADFLWGVNLSRALTLAMNSTTTGRSSIVTIGRVQGPTLAFVVNREIERAMHVPVPTWNVGCKLRKSKELIVAHYADSPIRERRRASAIYSVVSAARVAIVKKVSKTPLSIPPRYPFDLGELQREAYRLFRLSPKTTLSVAQNLYQRAMISYPRTDSQKLPEKIGYSKIFANLSSNAKYLPLVRMLQLDSKKRIRPWEGPRVDPAHPAIYPTGESSGSSLRELDLKVYDLIVRRFLNTFAPNEIIERTRTIFEISPYEFLFENWIIREDGWTAYYPFGRKYSESEAISMVEGETVAVVSASIREEYDPPPPRFSEGSLLSHMEREAIGTKATRAETISTLLDRDYIDKVKQELVPTLFGTELVENLERVSPGIVSTSLTRELERKLESVRSGSKDDIDFATEMLQSLQPVIRQLWRQKIQLDRPRRLPQRSLRKNQGITLGKCPGCKNGELILSRSPKTMKRFVRCTNYGKSCKNSSPALPRGEIAPTDQRCEKCGWPIVTAVSEPGKTTTSCSNYACVLAARSK